MSIWTQILNNIDEYKNIFYEKKTKEEYFFTPILPFSRIRLWEEFFFNYTQINLNISYEDYINKYSGNYFNLFGQVKKNLGENKIISNYLYYEKEKEQYIKNINKQNKEIEKLKTIIKCLCIDNSVDKNIYEAIPKDCENVLNNLARENGGRINLNEEETKYIFKKTKNMFEGISNIKIKETEIKSEEKNNEISGEKEEINKKEESKSNEDNLK